MEENVEQLTARLHPVESVMNRLGVGRSMVFELMTSGRLRSVKVGRRRLVPESAIREFIAELDTAGNGGAA